MKPMKKVQILVGGCQEDCETPGAAIHGFLEACLMDPMAAQKFLDTTRLVVDGKPLGQKWARMFRELRIATRAQEIGETTKALCAFKNDLSREEARAAVTTGVSMSRNWSTEAVFSFEYPKGRWEFVLRPRGLEWLIVRVGTEAGNGQKD